MAGPNHFSGVFQKQVAAWLMHLLDHHFMVSLLQIVRRRFRMAEKSVGSLNVGTVNEDLWDALGRVDGHCGSNGDSSLIAAWIAQIDLAEMLLRPRGRGFLMYRRKVQEVRSSFCWASNFQRKFRAKFWVKTRPLGLGGDERRDSS